MKKEFSLKRTLKTSAVILTVYFAALFIFCQFWGIGHVPSESMAPTYEVGDFLLTDKTDKDIARGDVIVFTTTEGSEDGKEEYFLKRVVAVEGDVVTINFGRVFINGCAVEESYLPEGTYTQAGNNNKYVVPAGCVFVLGDNREHSLDSRYFNNPFVNIEDVFGTVIK